MLTSWFYCSRLLWQPKSCNTILGMCCLGQLAALWARPQTDYGSGPEWIVFTRRYEHVCNTMRLCVHASIALYLGVCVSLCPHMSLSVYLYLLCTQASVWLSSIRPRICPSIHTSVRQCICMRVRLFVSSSVSVCISVCVCLCAWTDAYMQ